MKKGGRAEVQARYKRAKELLRSEAYEDATEEFIWLWKSIPSQDPPMGGVRVSYMAWEMGRLVQSYPSARKRFEQLRTDAQKSDDRFDWLVLNEVLGDEQKTLSWFDEVKESADAAEKLERVASRLESLLIEKERWADITNFLYKKPLKELHEKYEFLKEIRKFERKNRDKDVPRYDPFCKSAGILYASLLAAGKKKKAEKLAQEAVKLSDSLDIRIELLKDAFSAGQFRPSQLKWLAKAKPARSKKVLFYQMRAAMYYALQQRELALKDIDQLIQLDGAVSDNYAAQGGILIGLKRNQQALEALNSAVDLNPKSALAITTRGYAHHKLNDDEAALKDLDEAAELDPRLSWCYIVRSAVYYRQKKYQQAYDLAAKAIELDSSGAAAFGRKGKAAFRLGLLDEALACLTKWTRDVDDSGEAYYYRALVYDKLGKADAAKSDRKESEKLGFKPEEGE